MTQAKPTHPLEIGVPYPLFDCFMDHEGAYPAPAAVADRRWFERARFGMMVHWNHSSLLAREISWTMQFPEDIGRPRLAMAEYEALAARFNPVEFSAKAWVELAQQAGMGYLLFVVKHHDGFAMWDTKTSDYKITRTPFGRDICREIADACHAAGMPLGWYYSPADWWHPASRSADWDTYVPYMQAQLLELMTGYGHIDILSFDFWSPACKHPSWEGFYRDLRRRCPRYLHSRGTPWASGDYEVFEHVAPYFRDPRSSTWNGIEAPGGYRSRMTCADQFETMLSIQPRRWSYWNGVAKPLATCVDSLVDCVSHGGNLTLNVTPDALGSIPPEQTQRLREIGAWMSTHGEAIVGTQGGPLLPILIAKAPADAVPGYVPDMLGGGGVRPRGSHCRAATTSSGHRLYLHVWPGITHPVVELPPEVAQVAVHCRRLGGGALPSTTVDGWLHVAVPQESGPMATFVVELTKPAADLPQVAFRVRTG
ncbi:alpha-L-fucosidase [Planctomycetota bacterium]|nr:alpha-L-fucosidase [Planctomycetota bacterium]